jgi:ribosomal protein L27
VYRHIVAKYNGDCHYSRLSACDGIKAGQDIVYARRGMSWHPGCGPIGVSRHADFEYMQGMVDAQEEQWTRNTLGEVAANQFEMERYFKYGDDY